MIGCTMRDKLRHKCSRCQTVGRDVEWQPLLGDFMHHICWLEHAQEIMDAAVVGRKGLGRPERVARILGEWFYQTEVERPAGAPSQRDLFT